VVRARVVQAAAQLDSAVVVGKSHPFHRQQRRAGASSSSAAAAASAATARICSSARTMRTPNSLSNNPYIGPS